MSPIGPVIHDWGAGRDPHRCATRLLLLRTVNGLAGVATVRSGNRISRKEPDDAETTRTGMEFNSRVHTAPAEADNDKLTYAAKQTRVTRDGDVGEARHITREPGEGLDTNGDMGARTGGPDPLSASRR